MHDQSNANENPNRPLSEISHLFLSSVREKQTGSSPRPQRTPPRASTPTPSQAQSQRNDPPSDLTPEEFAQVVGSTDDFAPPRHRSTGSRSARAGAERMPAISPSTSIVLAAHLNGHQRERVREYAAHLCKTGERIGLVEIDAGEFRVSCFELGTSEAPAEPATCDVFDARVMSEVLEELSWDVDRWIINVPNPRLAEARSLLRSLENWTVLATCDHDGVVACYRSLKGLSDFNRAEQGEVSDGPVLSLALLDARDEMQSMAVFRKLSAVCQQFLHWPLESEAPVLAAGSVVEHRVLVCRSTRDKAQLASAPQWQVVSDFLKRRTKDKADAPIAHDVAINLDSATPNPPPTSTHEESPMQFSKQSSSVDSAAPSNETIVPEVFDLPAGAVSASAIVAATLRGGSELVECPLRPPMLEQASLAVGRDRRLVLLAVARQGLSDLRLIGEAWRWMNENRALIAMAMPQLSIDPHQLPHLRLLIDRADLSASTLQPLLQTGNVTVQTYRKLRWGEKTGLLLEAA